MNKLPKRMTIGQIEAFKRDFKATFEGEEIDAEGIYNWATTTREFYEWFYTRFKVMCESRLASCGNLHSIERDYKPAFLEWATFQIVPCNYADFISGLTTKGIYNHCIDAAEMIYDYYLQQFKESMVAQS